SDKMCFLTPGAEMRRESRTGGRTSEAKARSASREKGRKTAKAKRRTAPAAARGKRLASDPINDLQEAREQQAATAEILKVIASSPNYVQPVFDSIVRSAKRLLGGHTAGLYHIIDDMVYLKAFTPLDAESDEALRNSFPSPRSRVPQIALVEKGESFQFADTENAPEFQVRIARARGFRSILVTPLTQAGNTVGMVAVARKKPGSFADHHVQLMKTFADQAVIAIENTRLFNEVRQRTEDLTESLQQQTATADVLQVINSSPGQLEPVFSAMLEKATHLCEAAFGILALCDGEQFRAAALHGVPAAYVEITRKPIRPLPTNPIGRMLRGERLIVSADVADE